MTPRDVIVALAGVEHRRGSGCATMDYTNFPLETASYQSSSHTHVQKNSVRACDKQPRTMHGQGHAPPHLQKKRLAPPRTQSSQPLHTPRRTCMHSGRLSQPSQRAPADTRSRARVRPLLRTAGPPQPTVVTQQRACLGGTPGGGACTSEPQLRCALPGPQNPWILTWSFLASFSCRGGKHTQHMRIGSHTRAR